MPQDPTHPLGASESGRPGQISGKALAQIRHRKAASALQMRLAGATWLEIAEAVGYATPRQALVAVERALKKELDDNQSQEKMRQMTGQRLDRLLRSVWTKAINPDHPDHLAAITKAREVIAQHAKLYGLDAPTQVVVHNPTQNEIEQWVTSIVTQQAPDVEEFDIFDADIVEDDDEDGSSGALVRVG